MNVKEFCEKANLHPLLKNKIFSKVDEKFLTKIGFRKDKYQGVDFLALSNNLPEKKESTGFLSEKQIRAKNNLFTLLIPEFIAQTERKGISLLSILMLTPSFNYFIKRIREDCNIDVKLIKKELLDKYPEKKEYILDLMKKTKSKKQKIEEHDNIVETFRKEKPLKVKKFSENIYNGLREEILTEDIFKEIVKKQKIKLDDLNDMVRIYCCNFLGLPKRYFGYIKNYILFEFIDKDDNLLGKNLLQKPEINIIKNRIDQSKSREDEDRNDFEPYFNLKIFGNTTKEETTRAINFLCDNFSEMLNVGNLKKSISKSEPRSLLKKGMLFYLIEKENLSNKEALGVLSFLGIEMKKNTIARDIKSFRKVLKI